MVSRFVGISFIWKLGEIGDMISDLTIYKSTTRSTPGFLTTRPWRFWIWHKGQGDIRYVTPRITSIAKFPRSIAMREAATCFEKCGRGGKGDSLLIPGALLGQNVRLGPRGAVGGATITAATSLRTILQTSFVSALKALESSRPKFIPVLVQLRTHSLTWDLDCRSVPTRNSCGNTPWF